MKTTKNLYEDINKIVVDDDYDNVLLDEAPKAIKELRHEHLLKKGKTYLFLSPWRHDDENIYYPVEPGATVKNLANDPAYSHLNLTGAMIIKVVQGQ